MARGKKVEGSDSALARFLADHRVWKLLLFVLGGAVFFTTIWLLPTLRRQGSELGTIAALCVAGVMVAYALFGPSRSRATGVVTGDPGKQDFTFKGRFGGGVVVFLIIVVGGALFEWYKWRRSFPVTFTFQLQGESGLLKGVSGTIQLPILGLTEIPIPLDGRVIVPDLPATWRGTAQPIIINMPPFEAINKEIMFGDQEYITIPMKRSESGDAVINGTFRFTSVHVEVTVSKVEGECGPLRRTLVENEYTLLPFRDVPASELLFQEEHWSQSSISVKRIPGNADERPDNGNADKIVRYQVRHALTKGVPATIKTSAVFDFPLVHPERQIDLTSTGRVVKNCPECGNAGFGPKPFGADLVTVEIVSDDLPIRPEGQGGFHVSDSGVRSEFEAEFDKTVSPRRISVTRDAIKRDEYFGVHYTWAAEKPVENFSK